MPVSGKLFIGAAQVATAATFQAVNAATGESMQPEFSVAGDAEVERACALAWAAFDPFRELEDMSDRLNRMFSRPALPRTNGKETMVVADWIPSVDVSETEGEYQIKAEIPDVKKEDVKVTLEDGVLTIQGQRKQEKEDTGKKYHRVERSYGSFVRSFTLPDLVDEEKVKAEFKDGVLNLQLPKSEKAKPKAIEVKVA